MKKTLVITTLCAIAAIFSGCWKKKDNTDNMNAVASTDAAAMSDEKPIKVAALDGMSPEPSGEDKSGENTNDEQAIDQLKDKEDDLEKREDNLELEVKELKKDVKKSKEKDENKNEMEGSTEEDEYDDNEDIKKN